MYSVCQSVAAAPLTVVYEYGAGPGVGGARSGAGQVGGVAGSLCSWYVGYVFTHVLGHTHVHVVHLGEYAFCRLQT